MKRIYVDAPLAPQQTQSLSDEVFHYVVRVLRCRDGEALTVFNGDGYDYAAILHLSGKKSATFTIAETTKNTNESPLHTILIQGVSKGDRMDLVMQKAVELGVNEIIPVRTDFCAVKLDESRAAKKMQHWQSIIISACEQCERAFIPVLHPIQSLSEVIASSALIEAELKWVLHPYEKPVTQSTSESHDFDMHSNLNAESHNFELNGDLISAPNSEFNNQKSRPKSIAILIGPEGGLSDKEVATAIRQNFQVKQLGKRILRTETAAIASLSLCQQLWGDWHV